MTLLLTACGDKDGDSGGADGSNDGADGSDGGDGGDGSSGDAPTPVADLNTITVDGVVFPLMESGNAPCASDSYLSFSASFGDLDLYYSLTAQYITDPDPASGRYDAGQLLWNLRGSDASGGTPDDTTEVYLRNDGAGGYELIWNDMTTNQYGEASYTTSGWVRGEL